MHTKARGRESKSHSWLSIAIHSSLERRVRMNFLKAKKLLATQNASPSLRMIFKLSSLAVLLLFCYTSVSTLFIVGRVAIPDGCARACPPQSDPSRFICGRNKVTGKLGLFDGECYFGRYNHCYKVRQREWIWNFKNLNFNGKKFSVRIYSIWAVSIRRFLIERSKNLGRKNRIKIYLQTKRYFLQHSQ
jgi:hypothetical protein